MLQMMTVASIVEWFLWQNFIKKSELSQMMYVKPARGMSFCLDPKTTI